MLNNNLKEKIFQEIQIIESKSSSFSISRSKIEPESLKKTEYSTIIDKGKEFLRQMQRVVENEKLQLNQDRER